MMSSITDSRDQLLARYGRLAARERQMVLVVAAAVLLLLVWLILVRPAWNVLEKAPRQREAADLQLLQMQSIATEARQLRALPPVPASVAEQVLKSATDELGGKAKLQVQGDRATLSVTGINGEELRKWLIQARGGARARPVEANLARAGDGYNGTLIVTVGAQ